MAKLPTHLSDGEPLIYHRLTAHMKLARSRVADLCDKGFVLVPFNERREHLEGIPEGIDAIDVAAGDGDAIFCTPLHPHTGQAQKKEQIRRAPGVAWALRDLEPFGCTLRVEDLQWAYAQIFVDEIRDAVRDADLDFDGEVGMLSSLDEAFQLIRSVGETEHVRAALLTEVWRVGELPTLAACITAADRALSGIVLEYAEGEMDDDTTDKLRDELAQNIRQACEFVAERWEHLHTASNLELCVWSQVPLSLAALTFDARGFDWREPSSSAPRRGFGMLAERAR